MRLPKLSFKIHFRTEGVGFQSGNTYPLCAYKKRGPGRANKHATTYDTLAVTCGRCKRILVNEGQQVS